ARTPPALAVISTNGAAEKLDLPPDIFITGYLSGADQAIATCNGGGVCVLDRRTGAWSRLLTTSWETDHGVFDDNANIVRLAEGFAATNGSEVWVVPAER